MKINNKVFFSLFEKPEKPFTVPVKQAFTKQVSTPNLTGAQN